jgi:hypothetical protein
MDERRWCIRVEPAGSAIRGGWYSHGMSPLISPIDSHATLSGFARFVVVVLLAASMFMTGCRGRESAASEFEKACNEVPGCAASLAAAPVPRESIWRVELIRETSGPIRIGRIESVEVEQGRGVPLGRSAGTHMLVALDGAGASVDGYVVRFPESMRIERVDDWSGQESIALAGQEVDTYGYLRATPDVAEIALTDPSGTVVARAPLPKKSARQGRGQRSGGFDSLFATAIALPAGASDNDWIPDLPPQCAHVILIDGERQRDRVRGISFEKEVVLLRPDPLQRAAIQSALFMMTPLLCHGVSRLAIGNVPGDEGTGGIVKLAIGDLMLINVAVGYRDIELARNVEKRLEMMHTILHEAAHSTEILLNAEGSRPENFGGLWRPAQRSLAASTIERARLEKSLAIEWRRMHQSFVSRGWASGYPSSKRERERARERSAADVARAGFISRYGGTNYADDIADMVAWTYMGKHYRAAGVPEGRRQTEDYGCQEMRKHQSRDLPSGLSALYSKMMLLRDLGMVHPEDVELCTGQVGLPVEKRGLHFWEGGNFKNTFDTDVAARIATIGSQYVFELTGSGWLKFGDQQYPADATLRLALDPASTPLKEVSWPRGVYPLALTGNNSFEIRLDGAPAGNFRVYEGFALVAEATNERITGSVFITKAMRLNAPFPVPQVFDPPLVVRFLIDK